MKHAKLSSLSHNHCQIALKSIAPGSFRSFQLSGPQRLVLDLTHARVVGLKKQFKFCGVNFRSAPRQHAFRIVADLQSKIHIRPIYKAKYKSLILDIKRVQPTSKTFTIVIDPGHGGHDPGAIGWHSLKEKNVVLALAQSLKRNLDHIKNLKVILTRNKDHYLTLRQRLYVARHAKADLFVAIHADAHYHSEAHGISVFAVSDRGATSEAARWLAKKENISEMLGGANLEQQSHSIRSIIISLQQQATIKNSLKVGQSVLKMLAQVAHLHSQKVEQAAFVVLKSPDIPSILIETGFLSNQHEGRLLSSSYYRQKLANRIATGLLNYIRHNHPEVSLTEWNIVKHPAVPRKVIKHHDQVHVRKARKRHHNRSHSIKYSQKKFIHHTKA